MQGMQEREAEPGEAGKEKRTFRLRFLLTKIFGYNK
jgi:hypothetical protein